MKVASLTGFTNLAARSMKTIERVESKVIHRRSPRPEPNPLAPNIVFFLLFLFGWISLWDLFLIREVKLPTLKEAASGVKLYDRNDRLICTVHEDRDVEPVPFSKISPHLRNAVVAAEDRHFFDHIGVDPSSIARAFVANYKAGKIVQGASTIPQQLVRNLYLDPEDRSYSRKLKEAIMALNVSLHYSKDKILETYLNEIYFGAGAHGAERAAQKYFNKHAKDLSIAESAFLVGLIREPSRLSQERYRKDAMARSRDVLQDMKNEGFITDAELKQATGAVLNFKHGPERLRYPYYMGCVLTQVQQELGDKLWKNEWHIYTNLDMKAQQESEKILNKSIKSAPRGIDQAALVTMSLKDGAVLAIVGGVGEKTRWNRALAAHTAGSAFKPFVYLAAMIQGSISADTLINDAPLRVEQDKYSPVWEPKNFDGRYSGWTTVRNALAFSRNVCAARVALETGLGEVVRIAREAGIRTQMDPYPSLALGSCAVTPLNMTTAYATLARGGIQMAPRFIRRIENEKREKYHEYASPGSSEFDSEKVAQLVDVLRDVVRYGTGTRAALPGIAVAGKTGTADQSRDLWFVGFTPDTITTVWAGNDQNNAVKNKQVTGGRVMAGIWRQVMQSFYRTHKPPYGQDFANPVKAFISSVPIDLSRYTSESEGEQYSGLAVNGEAYPSYAKRINKTGIARAEDLVALRKVITDYENKQTQLALAHQEQVQQAQQQKEQQEQQAAQLRVQQEREEGDSLDSSSFFSPASLFDH